MFIPKNSQLWEIQEIDDIYFMGIFVVIMANCYFWTFQKDFGIKLYIHEETLDIGFKIMVIVCI